jgi:hypothetical protein
MAAKFMASFSWRVAMERQPLSHPTQRSTALRRR